MSNGDFKCPIFEVFDRAAGTLEAVARMTSTLQESSCSTPWFEEVHRAHTFEARLTQRRTLNFSAILVKQMSRRDNLPRSRWRQLAMQVRRKGRREERLSSWYLHGDQETSVMLVPSKRVSVYGCGSALQSESSS